MRFESQRKTKETFSNKNALIPIFKLFDDDNVSASFSLNILFISNIKLMKGELTRSNTF